jgi:hypothetical protein
MAVGVLKQKPNKQHSWNMKTKLCIRQRLWKLEDKCPRLFEGLIVPILSQLKEAAEGWQSSKLNIYLIANFRRQTKDCFY